ncbi:MAG TPA: DUF1592 domain-containing protein [Polyangiales bacterium]|nr:DUF1592 domain-containing protein [Polyangiales bacterium]
MHRSIRKPDLRAHRPKFGWILVIAALAPAMGCEGSIGDPLTAGGAGDVAGAGPDVLQPRSPNGNPTTTPSPNGTPNPTGKTDPTAPVNPATCKVQAAAPAPLARLTNQEYRNTVADLFEGLTLPELSLPPDNVVEGFDNNAKAQTPSPALIEAYRGGAQTVAAAVLANTSAVLPCKPANASQEASCGQQWIDAFAPRVYRRPLSAEEKGRITTFFNNSRTAYGFNTAVSMVVQGLLQSPQFLYRPELGGAAKSGSAPLTGYELASRLSYFFWDTMPDEELLDAAAGGKLDSAAGVETQARRLLDDPRARPAVAAFHRQWLRFDKMDSMRKDSGMYPGWNDQVADSLRTSVAKFVEHVFWDMNGSLSALLTDSGAYVNDDTAAIYGVAKPGSKDLVWSKTDATRRSGILTQAGLLAGFAHETADSPVLRGVFVMDRFFCSAPPPPPPGVTGSVTDETSSTMPMTTRDRFAMTHESGTCATCHHTIDGFGFGFSHYDAVGGWRETENGLAVNAKGWISNTQDANGDFDGAVELGKRMAASGQVSECVSAQWYRYALSLGSDDADACTVAQISEALKDNQGDLREVLIATVSSDAFRNRPEVTP